MLQQTRKPLAFFANSGYKVKLVGLSNDLVRRAARRAGWLAGAALVAVYGWITLRGPQGVDALLDKHREVQRLQEQNAALAHENDLRRQRIQRLESNSGEQEMEIRKQLKLLRPGETTFILPDRPKAEERPKPVLPEP